MLITTAYPNPLLGLKTVTNDPNFRTRTLPKIPISVSLCYIFNNSACSGLTKGNRPLFIIGDRQLCAPGYSYSSYSHPNGEISYFQEIDLPDLGRFDFRLDVPKVRDAVEKYPISLYVLHEGEVIFEEEFSGDDIKNKNLKFTIGRHEIGIYSSSLKFFGDQSIELHEEKPSVYKELSGEYGYGVYVQIPGEKDLQSASVRPSIHDGKDLYLPSDREHWIGKNFYLKVQDVVRGCILTEEKSQFPKLKYEQVYPSYTISIHQKTREGTVVVVPPTQILAYNTIEISYKGTVLAALRASIE